MSHNITCIHCVLYVVIFVQECELDRAEARFIVLTNVSSGPTQLVQQGIAKVKINI
jgi:hypothetical protein